MGSAGLKGVEIEHHFVCHSPSGNSKTLRSMAVKSERWKSRRIMKLRGLALWRT